MAGVCPFNQRRYPVRIARQIQERFVQRDLRDFLGARKVAGNVNYQIKKTAEGKPGNFFVLNNGITLVTKKAELQPDDVTLRIYGVSVVNGAQTTGADLWRRSCEECN